MKRGRKTRVSGTQKHGRLPINELPDDLYEEILLRLSANELLRCRCVCKTWRNLISDPEFSKKHSAKGEVYPLIRSLSTIHMSRTLYLVEPPVCNSNGMDWKSNLDTKLKLPFLNTQAKRKPCTKFRAIDHRFNVMNSCNGLLCLSEPIKNDPVAVFNPITREYINLPVPTEDKKSTMVNCALGFSPNTNKYKVIRMFRLPNKGREIYSRTVAEIHTLGTSSWTRIRSAPSSYENLGFPTYLNGALHWLDSDYRASDYIISFDFVNEIFQSIPQPPKFNPYYSISYKDISLGELRGCLCFSYFNDGKVVVWVMEDYHNRSSWTIKYHLNATDKGGDFLWSAYQPISVLNNGGLLLFHRKGSALMSYDAEGKHFKYLKIRGVKSKYEAIPYVPSFASLKDVLAGEELEVLKVNPRLKLQGETKPLYLEEEDAQYDSDLLYPSSSDSDDDD